MADSKKKVPDSMGEQIGDMSVDRGRYGKKQIRLYAWDAVPECSGTKCPAFSLCSYEKTGKCQTVVQYLRNIHEFVFQNFGKEFDEAKWFRIGMHLIPLYKTLARLQIAELGVTDVIVTVGNKGPKINPIFDAITKTIAQIEKVWKDMNLSEKGLKKPNRGQLGVGNRKNTFFDMSSDGTMVGLPEDVDIEEDDDDF